MDPLNPIKHDVEPHQMLGWLESVLAAGRIVDVAEWNEAVKALQGGAKGRYGSVVAEE